MQQTSAKTKRTMRQSLLRARLDTHGDVDDVGGADDARFAAAAHAYAASSASCLPPSRREMTFETPLPAIETPYRQSAASIVRFWWVTTMNCARSLNERSSVRKRSILRSSSAASTSSRM